jgi:hypothetical protein
MERLVFEISVVIALVWSIFYYRRKYRNSVIHHRDAAILWQKLMLGVLSEQITAHFKNSMVNNHIVRVRENQIEIMIGDEDSLVPINMESFKLDPAAALEDAYSKFVANVNR